MGVYKYLFIHCTATVEGKEITPDHIERMHKGAKDLPGGKVQFNNKTYSSRKALPNVEVGGVLASRSNGRGWDRLGYSMLFTENGNEFILTEQNDDLWLENKEITYGAGNFNSVSKHFVYAGGLLKETYTREDGKTRHYFANTMTPIQELAFLDAIRKEIRINPNVKIIGHNQTANKGCPCFDVRLWLEVHNIPTKNIDKRALRTNLRSPFKNSIEGNDFRKWVNDNHKDIAKKLDLDPKGSHTNDYILKAYYLLRHEY
jgi:hypothetical protein